MNLQIRNCNNIDQCTVSIVENRLNIKYAINGTGKSTISKAISAAVSDRSRGTDQLSTLTPFKAVGRDDLKPTVQGAEAIQSVMTFDEDYVSSFEFQPDELVKGSFDIFIRNEGYTAGMTKIDELVAELKSILSQDKDVADLINDFTELSASFGRQTKSGIHGSSIISKALKSGNKVANVPPGLEVFKDYIQREDNYKWIKWQLDGKDFIDISDNCPYCVTEIKDKKSTIKKVSEVYEPKSIENLNKIVAVFQRLNRYFTDDTKKVIDGFVKNVDGYSGDQVAFLREVKDQIDRLNVKFINAQNIGFVSLKDIDKLIDGLKEFRIDISLYNHLASENTIQKVQIVNSQIDKLIEKAGQLQGSVNKQKQLIQHLVDEHCAEINAFLRNGGFSYKVHFTATDGGEYRLKLLHSDLSDEVQNAKDHLSFGERNAFAIVLFMYHALKSQPDLIILDDPISSFDKNKKYAIVDMLFRKERSFRGKTVILLTHDFEPIVDMVLHHTDRFEKPSAVFLENTHGRLSEKLVERTDIKTFIDINIGNVSRDIPAINKIIYLRRYYEILNERGAAYQLISNLLHKRETPIVQATESAREMSKEERDAATTEIRTHIQDFEYSKLLSFVKDDAQLKRLYNAATNNYERLHIYRLIFADKADSIESDVIQKFINQAFHTENDYIYQLDPSTYQTVPQYVIDECDRFVSFLK